MWREQQVNVREGRQGTYAPAATACTDGARILEIGARSFLELSTRGLAPPNA